MTTASSSDSLITKLISTVEFLANQVTSLNEKVEKLTLLSAENASKPKAKSSKSSASGSNPVGLDPSNSEPEMKFPSNIINWIKYKVIKDNNYLKNILGAAYSKLESKHAEDLKSKNLTGDAYQKSLAQLIWTDIVNNSKSSTNEEVKRQCTMLIKYFKESREKEFAAFNAAKSANAPAPQSLTVGGVSIPEPTLVVPAHEAEHTNGTSQNGYVSGVLPPLPSLTVPTSAATSLFGNHTLSTNLSFAPVSLGYPAR